MKKLARNDELGVNTLKLPSLTAVGGERKKVIKL